MKKKTFFEKILKRGIFGGIIFRKGNFPHKNPKRGISPAFGGMWQLCYFWRRSCTGDVGMAGSMEVKFPLHTLGFSFTIVNREHITCEWLLDIPLRRNLVPFNWLWGG